MLDIIINVYSWSMDYNINIFGWFKNLINVSYTLLFI